MEFNKFFTTNNIKKSLQVSYSNSETRIFYHHTPQIYENISLLLLNHSIFNKWRINTKSVNFPMYLSGQKISDNMFPIIQNYAGTQYGYLVKNLGDGRTILLGEIKDNNKRYEIQVKGIGKTIFSRDGDGYSTLRACFKEYFTSLFLNSIGISCIKPLGVFSTGINCIRDFFYDGSYSIEQCGLFVRCAPNFLRVGTFQKINNIEAKKLLDFVILHHYTELTQLNNKYDLLFKKLCDNWIKTIAYCQAYGIVLGTLNTDDMCIDGCLLDLKTMSFLDTYDPDTSNNIVDKQNRYAFKNQPKIVLDNLEIFYNSIKELLNSNPLNSYNDIFKNYYFNIMRTRLGLVKKYTNDMQLIFELFGFMAKDSLDYNYVLYLLSTFDLNT